MDAQEIKLTEAAKQSIEIGFRQSVDSFEAMVGRNINESEKIMARYFFGCGGAYSGNLIQRLTAEIVK